MWLSEMTLAEHVDTDTEQIARASITGMQLFSAR